MNIAIDIGGIVGFRGGGIERVVVQLCQTMTRRFPKDQFYIFDLFGEGAFVKKIQAENVHHCYYFSGKNGALRKYRGEFQELLGVLVHNFISENQIDVFYVSAPFLATPDVGQNAVYQSQWFEKTAVVAQLYDIIPYLMREKYLPTKQDYEKYMDCVQLLHWADGVLAISNSARDDAIKAFGLEPEKISLAYLGNSGDFHKIDVPKEEKAALYEQFGITKPFLMCSASADARKNVISAIEAFSMLPERLRSSHQMVIVGRISAETQAHYQKLIHRRKLGSSICFTGFVTQEQLVQLYNLAKLLIFPSLYEGFGIPVLEAWACGTAVAASNNSGLGEVVGDAGLTFDPKDPTDIARTLEQAFTSTDLDALARLGEERLRQFTWERTADITMEMFRVAVQKKRRTLAEKKEKLFCVFLTDTPLPPAWKTVLSRLARHAVLTVVTQEAENRWDPEIEIWDWEGLQHCALEAGTETVYIAPDQISARAFAQIKQRPGKWLVMDQAMDELILWISGLAEDGLSEFYGLAQKLRQYFISDHQERLQASNFLPYLTGVITAGSEKRIQLSNYILEIPIYNISPGKIHDKYTAEKELAFDNLKNALCERSMISDRSAMLSLCEQEVRDQKYSTAELRAFSKTVGTAFGTEPVMQRIAHKAVGEKLKVAMVSSWNMKCGIAEFTKYYVEASENQVDYRIYPHRTEALLGPEDEKTKERLWDTKGSLDRLIEELSRSDEDVVHLQYTEGFFLYEELCKLAQALPPEKIIVATCHNCAFIQIKTQRERKLLNRIRFAVHQEKDREHLLRQGIRDEQVFLVPLGQLAASKREASAVHTALGMGTASPVSGSYGFLFPHKGIAKTIQAVALLKKIWPDILYLPCCSFFHVKEASFPYYKECLEIVHALGLEHNVRFVTDFLKPEESILLLQSCDVLVSAYDTTVETASGANRFSLAARRPIITTNEPIFREFADCTIQIPNNTPEEIAGALEPLLKQGADTQMMDALEKHLEATSWPVTVQKYMELYRK